MRILHIAPFNIAGVPITLVKAERELGHQSRLITLAHDRRNYEEDLCLHLPFLDFRGTRWLKRWVSDPARLAVDNRRKRPSELPPTWRPHGLVEQRLVRLRERLWQKTIRRVMAEIDFWNFDLYQLDAGLEFFRDGRTVRRLKALGKSVICCYTGSDLRTRGVIPEIDALSDLNVTFEFDHLQLHPRIEHVFFPFDVRNFAPRVGLEGAKKVRIGHAPTNRRAKGSDLIIATVQELARANAVELVLIEGLPHREALRRKAECDIFVDQLGDLGYGINALEALAMGIPTCSALAPGFEERYPDHPFVAVDERSLRARLLDLIQNEPLRRELGAKGRRWVAQHHDSRQVVKRIHELLRQATASLSEERGRTVLEAGRPT